MRHRQANQARRLCGSPRSVPAQRPRGGDGAWCAPAPRPARSRAHRHRRPHRPWRPWCCGDACGAVSRSLRRFRWQWNGGASAGSACSAAADDSSSAGVSAEASAAGAAVSACTGFDAGSAVGGSLKSGPCSSTLSSTVAPAAPAPRTTRRPVRRRRGAAGCSLVDEESIFDAVSSGSKPCSVCSGTMLLLVAPCCNPGALVLAPCGLTPYSHHGRAVTAPAGSNPKVKSCGNGHRRSRN